MREISGSECVTSMGGNVENGVSVLDGCSGRTSILFGISRAAVTNLHNKEHNRPAVGVAVAVYLLTQGIVMWVGKKWEGKCVREG